MEWDLARIAIRGVEAGTDLNTSKSNCRSFVGNTERGVKVQIGKSIQIEIGDEVLKPCFNALSTPHGYNTWFFQEKFPNLYKTHGCHVHAIGQLFVKAGLARQNEERYFLK
jgi:hypothetical protein